MGWLDLSVVALTFLLIFPAELPDKTFIATLVLSTRYRRVPVWIGVAAAFAVQCATNFSASMGMASTGRPRPDQLSAAFACHSGGTG